MSRIVSLLLIVFLSASAAYAGLFGIGEAERGSGRAVSDERGLESFEAIEIECRAVIRFAHRHAQMAEAGAADAETVLELEQGAVDAALNQLPVQIQELIRHPVQGYARVGATVAVGLDLVLMAHHEKVPG